MSYKIPLAKQQRRRKGWGWLLSQRVCWWSRYQFMDEGPRWRQVFWLTEPGQAVTKFPPQSWLRRLCPGYREILQGQATCWHDFPEFPLGRSWVHGGTQCSLVWPCCGVRIRPRLQSWGTLDLCLAPYEAQKPVFIFPCFQHLENGADDNTFFYLLFTCGHLSWCFLENMYTQQHCLWINNYS